MKTKNISFASAPWRMYLILAALPLVLASCEKYLEVGLPKTQLPAEAVFETDATANAAMAALHARAAGFTGGASGSVTYLGAYLADETDNYATTVALQQLASNQLISTNTFSTGLWNTCYATIYQCNALIEGLSGNTNITPALNTQLTAEAHFIRGLSHLYLASFYGDVPIVTSTDYRLNTVISQSPRAEVLAFVIAEIAMAKPLLPDTYASFGNERIRPTKWAAAALLARAQLYAGNWEQAQLESSEVIANTAMFSLTAFNDAFLKNSREQILQYRSNSTTANTSEGNTFILTAKPTQLALSPGFIAGFETGDLRRTNWTSKVTVSGIDYYFPYKYKIKTGTVMNEYSSMLRLAEQYLIRAEAQARLDRLPAAIADIDVVRVRAGLPRIAITSPAISKTALLDAMLRERKSELFTEWAHRWVDLQRFGRATLVLPLLKPAWQPYAQLLPIPDYDIRVNQSLKQNPGYQ